MAATSKNGAAARTRSVGTKLTAEEFARLESLAAGSGQSVSEWSRSALLGATTPANPNPNNSSDAAVLAEVWALRAIVLNLFRLQKRRLERESEEVEDWLREREQRQSAERASERHRAEAAQRGQRRQQWTTRCSMPVVANGRRMMWEHVSNESDCP